MTFRYVVFILSCSALASLKTAPWLLARFRDFERPEHALWSPAGTHTCNVVYRRPPCVPCGRELEKRPAAGREKLGDVQKNFIFYIVTQGSPSGCGWLEIPGVSQVEKGEHRRHQTSLFTPSTAACCAWYTAVCQDEVR